MCSRAVSCTALELSPSSVDAHGLSSAAKLGLAVGASLTSSSTRAPFAAMSCREARGRSATKTGPSPSADLQPPLGRPGVGGPRAETATLNPNLAALDEPCLVAGRNPGSQSRGSPSYGADSMKISPRLAATG